MSHRERRLLTRQKYVKPHQGKHRENKQLNQFRKRGRNNWTLSKSENQSIKEEKVRISEKWEKRNSNLSLSPESTQSSTSIRPSKIICIHSVVDLIPHQPKWPNSPYIDLALALRRIGAGGFGKVYLVASRRDGTLYAAKYQKIKDKRTQRLVRNIQQFFELVFSFLIWKVL